MAQELCLPSQLLRHYLFHSSYGGGEEANSNAVALEEKEEDRLAALTQRMARYLLREDDGDKEALGNEKVTNRVLRPLPSMESRAEKEACDLIYEAFGDVKRQRGLDDLERCRSPHGCGILGYGRKPSLAVYGAPDNIDAGCYAPALALTRQQLQAAHFYRLKRQQLIKQQMMAAQARQNQQIGDCGKVYGEGRCGCPQDLPLRKPSHAMPCTRTPIVNISGGRKESIGTGVFIPRPQSANNNHEPKKKTAKSAAPLISVFSSTQMDPEKMNRAIMDLNMESAIQSSFPCYNDVPSARRGAALSQINKNHHLLAQPQTTATVAAHEIGLPQEWTY